MFCLQVWCQVPFVPQGNTKVFAELSGKFLGRIHVEATDTLKDVKTKASKHLPHVQMYDPRCLRVRNSKETFHSWSMLAFDAYFHKPNLDAEIWVAWDEDYIRKRLQALGASMQNIVFDGSKVSIKSNRQYVFVHEAIEIYGLATTFECTDRGHKSTLHAHKLSGLENVTTVSITGCRLIMFGRDIPHKTSNLSVVHAGKKRDFNEVFARFAYLTALRSLRLQGILHGNISDDISNLTNLTTLDLAFNQLCGEVSRSIGKLVNLEELFLQHNFLQGKLYLEKCTKLRRLDVSHNFFSDTLLEDIECCCAQHVDYSHNNF